MEHSNFNRFNTHGEIFSNIQKIVGTLGRTENRFMSLHFNLDSPKRPPFGSMNKFARVFVCLPGDVKKIFLL
jgi:hypothetical protein